MTRVRKKRAEIALFTVCEKNGVQVIKSKLLSMMRSKLPVDSSGRTRTALGVTALFSAADVIRRMTYPPSPACPVCTAARYSVNPVRTVFL